MWKVLVAPELNPSEARGLKSYAQRGLIHSPKFHSSAQRGALIFRALSHEPQHQETRSEECDR